MSLDVVQYMLHICVCACVCVLNCRGIRSISHAFKGFFLVVGVFVCLLTREWGRVELDFGQPHAKQRDEMGCHQAFDP